MDSARMMNIEFVDETGTVEAESLGQSHSDRKRTAWELGDDDSDSDGTADKPRPGKKTRGRVKIRMAYINDKVRRYTTFSKRKTGIMKKAYELAVLTGTQVMLLVASETGHVYTFATRKLQPVIMSENGKALIQTCLNSPDSPPLFVQTVTVNNDQRMNPLGFEEPDLSSCVTGDAKSTEALEAVAQTAAVAAMKQPSSNKTAVRQTPDPGASVVLMPNQPAPLSIVLQHQSRGRPRQLITTPAYPTTSFEGQGQVIQIAAPESCTQLMPATAAISNPEGAPAQMYYRIAGTNQYILLPDHTKQSADNGNELTLSSSTTPVQPLTIVNVGGATAEGAMIYDSPQTVVLPVSGTAPTPSSENSTMSLPHEIKGESVQEFLMSSSPASGSEISPADEPV